MDVQPSFAERIQEFQRKVRHDHDELYVFREYLSELTMMQLRSNVKYRRMKCARSRNGLTELLVKHLKATFKLDDDEVGNG